MNRRWKEGAVKATSNPIDFLKSLSRNLAQASSRITSAKVYSGASISR